MHKYDATGRLVEPWENGLWSPTTILDITRKRKIEEWQDRVGWEEAERLRDNKATLGSLVHESIEYWLNAKDYAEFCVHVEEEIPYVTGMVNWLDDKWYVRETEKFVVSKKYEYAGTCDIVADCIYKDENDWLNTEPWVIDIKTGSPQPTHGIQLKAYQQALYEMTGEKYRMGALYLGTGTQKQWKWKEYDEPMNLFLAYKKIFDWHLKHDPIRQPIEWDGGMIG